MHPHFPKNRLPRNPNTQCHYVLWKLMKPSDNPGWVGEYQQVPSPTSCPQQGQLQGQTRLLTALFSWVSTTWWTETTQPPWAACPTAGPSPGWGGVSFYPAGTRSLSVYENCVSFMCYKSEHGSVLTTFSCLEPSKLAPLQALSPQLPLMGNTHPPPDDPLQRIHSTGIILYWYQGARGWAHFSTSGLTSAEQKGRTAPTRLAALPPSLSAAPPLLLSSLNSERVPSASSRRPLIKVWNRPAPRRHPRGAPLLTDLHVEHQPLTTGCRPDCTTIFSLILYITPLQTVTSQHRKQWETMSEALLKSSFKVLSLSISFFPLISQYSNKTLDRTY